MSPPEAIRLPGALLEQYQKSKQSTRKVVQWLLENGGELPEGSSEHIPVASLKRAASNIQWRNIEASEEVCYSFEDAIRARRHMTSFYKSTEGSQTEETETHEHFTSFLEATLKSLRPSAPSHSPPSTPPPSTLPNPASELSEGLNQFSILDTIQEDADAAMSRYEASTRARASMSLSSAYVGMEDELMEKVLAVHGLVLELDIMCSKVKDIWHQASTGAISLIAAAWLTNGAYHMIRENLGSVMHLHIFGEKAHHQDLCDLADLANKLPPFKYPDEIRFPIDYEVFRSMHGMLTPMDAFSEAFAQMTADDKAKKAISNVTERVKLAEVITNHRNHDDLPRQLHAERKWMDSILFSMRQIEEENKMDVTSSLFDANPVMEDAMGPTTEDWYPDKPLTYQYKKETLIVFGLVLLVESTKSFMLPENAPPQTMNCRLKALKLASDVRASVTAIMNSRPIVPGSGDNYPVCTDDKVIMGLKLLENDLSAFLKKARWDFYYQAPWVAGAQMLWMLSQANDYGMVLCNRRRYVGAVLHLYNCLKQMGKIEAEPVLLERLCDTLGRQVFRSDSPPKTDFFKGWTRYIGREQVYDPKFHYACPFYESYSPDEDRLKFKPRDRIWRVATHKIPDDKRISLSKISHFYAMESIEYGIKTDEGLGTLARMLHVKEKGGDATDEEREKVRDILASQFLAITLEKMQPTIVDELEGDFPIAKINWFAVYLTCTGILSLLGKWMHANSDGDAENRERMTYDFELTGVRWIEFFLGDAERGARNRRTKKAWEKNAGPQLEAAVKYISDELREKTTADFVWQT